MNSDANIIQTPLKDLIGSLILKTHIPDRHPARNALTHIEKAWILKDIDPGMSAFRAITAVEEATSAIFHALKRKKYDNAKHLNKKKHFHKAAISPFLSAIETVLASLNLKMQLHYNTNDKKPKLQIAILPPFEDAYIYPVPPLGALMFANGSTYDFSAEIAAIITTQNATSFLQYSHDLTKERNRILYAEHRGIPDIKITEEYLRRKESLVITLLTIFLFIAQYNEKQLFAQQALDAYVALLKLTDKNKKNTQQ